MTREGSRKNVVVAVIAAAALPAAGCQAADSSSDSTTSVAQTRGTPTIVTSGQVTVPIVPLMGHSDILKTYHIKGLNDRGCVIGHEDGPSGEPFTGVFAGNAGTKVSGDKEDFKITFAEGKVARKGATFTGGGYVLSRGDDSEAETEVMDAVLEICGEDSVIAVE